MIELMIVLGVDHEPSFHMYAKQLWSDGQSFPGSLFQGHLHERVQKLLSTVSYDMSYCPQCQHVHTVVSLLCNVFFPTATSQNHGETSSCGFS